MKLSEAIRLGSMHLPPSKSGHVFDIAAGSRICGACAFGAAVYAVGLTWGMFGAERFGEAGRRLPLLATVVTPPVQHMPRESVGRIMSTLYECRGWTREQIADWVESLERAQETPAGCADQPAMAPALALPSAAQKCLSVT